MPKKSRKTERRVANPVTWMTAAMIFLMGLAGCGSATSQEHVSLEQTTPGGQTAPSAAAQFLGSDASLLQPGSNGQADWIYINSNVQWSSYKQVLLEPVEFWDNPDSGVSPDDQKMLCSYFYNKLQENLEKHFTLVSQPGPGVITFKVAIVNADAATPGLRSISVIVPQARILNYAQSLATGHAAFAGSVEAAFKATDSTTGQVLAESIDKRVGGMAPSQAAQVQWGDAESAMDYWAQRITQRAVELGAGNPATAGQPSASN